MLRFSKNGCKVGVLLFAILCALSGKAQRSVESQSLVWMRYKLALNTPGKWQFTSEVEERSYWFPWGSINCFGETGRFTISPKIGLQVLVSPILIKHYQKILRLKIAG